jgi:hypothetical protein
MLKLLYCPKQICKIFYDFQVRATDKKKAHFGPSFVMNRIDSASFRAGRIQLFHSAKMALIKPLSATFGHGRMGFFYSASSSSIRPKSAKMADKSATWQPCFSVFAKGRGREREKDDANFFPNRARGFCRFVRLQSTHFRH